MRASLEPLCPAGFWQRLGRLLGLCGAVYLLRLHRDPAGQLGDPYHWFTVIVRHGKRAVIKGALSGITVEGGDAMRAALKGVGFRRWRWYDIDGNTHDREF